MALGFYIYLNYTHNGIVSLSDFAQKENMFTFLVLVAFALLITG